MLGFPTQPGTSMASTNSDKITDIIVIFFMHIPLNIPPIINLSGIIAFMV